MILASLLFPSTSCLNLFFLCMLPGTGAQEPFWSIYRVHLESPLVREFLDKFRIGRLAAKDAAAVSEQGRTRQKESKWLNCAAGMSARGTQTRRRSASLFNPLLVCPFRFLFRRTRSEKLVGSVRQRPAAAPGAARPAGQAVQRRDPARAHGGKLYHVGWRERGCFCSCSLSPWFAKLHHPHRFFFFRAAGPTRCGSRGSTTPCRLSTRASTCCT